MRLKQGGCSRRIPIHSDGQAPRYKYLHPQLPRKQQQARCRRSQPLVDAVKATSKQRMAGYRSEDSGKGATCFGQFAGDISE
jgi:hypothetical protein